MDTDIRSGLNAAPSQRPRCGVRVAPPPPRGSTGRGDRLHVPCRRRAGQAAVEFVIGFITLIMILAGGIQYLAVSNAHRGLTTTLRGEAGERAMNPVSVAATPSYLLTWDDGRDDIRHTDDDIPDAALLPQTLSAIADRSARGPADWDRLEKLRRVNPLSGMHESLLPTTELGLIQVERSDSVAVDPAVRSFIFDRPSVTVRHTVWLPLMGGLY